MSALSHARTGCTTVLGERSAATRTAESTLGGRHPAADASPAAADWMPRPRRHRSSSVLPTPAAARASTTADPSPPAPTTATCAAARRRCPSSPSPARRHGAQCGHVHPRRVHRPVRRAGERACTQAMTDRAPWRMIASDCGPLCASVVHVRARRWRRGTRAQAPSVVDLPNGGANRATGSCSRLISDFRQAGSAGRGRRKPTHPSAPADQTRESAAIAVISCIHVVVQDRGSRPSARSER